MNERASRQSGVPGMPFPSHRLLDTATLAKGIEASSVGIIVTDASPEQAILFANDAFLRMTGYAREEVLGRNCRFLQGSDTSAEALREIADALRDCREVTTELLNYRKDGSTFWNLLYISPIRDEMGQTTHFFGYLRDISQRKETEEALQQAMRLEALGKLTGGVAHDYNNLLQVIQTSLEMIELSVAADEDIARRTARTIDTCRRAIDRAGTLTKQLMVFAKRQTFASKPIDINQLLERLSSVLTQALGEQIHVGLHLQPQLWYCNADPAQAEPILLNIAINARDAMKGAADQRLDISTFNRELLAKEAALRSVEPGRYVEIVIADNGPGMPPDVLKRVLDPFFTTKTEGKGAGLGLSVAYGFARQSGGSLHVESKQGAGTSIHLLLPYTVASLPELQDEDSETGVQPRILLVEDRSDVAYTTKQMLELLGYQAAIANDAESALRMLEHNDSFELLLSDVIMPGSMDGVALARTATRQQPNLKVLLVTGYAPLNEKEAVEFPVLGKPYRHADLARKLRELL
ncbi:PAS domain S-box protein [Dyella flagellata]|uniref:histidine kinase n=1 Tax=Dyella flagellata TaxID=1867833 RepID=A0ABQ5XAT5_9GAMM|nr:PAS domain-containing protein [Dyella flagellata]GLQ88377.1 hybrid sensor histidine kinase/response regulator [Dyella flagellata]